jgi:ATP-dependent helicase/nuclease subunit A
MTVHGAKGLEAPVVILADTTTQPQGPAIHQPRLFTLACKDAPPQAPGHLVWSARKDDDIAIIATARAASLEAAENEYRRLLYVAMTRAADRLIVCGATTLRGKPPSCWYELIAEALKPPTSVAELADDGEGEVWRFRKAPPEAVAAAAVAAKTTPLPALPAWLKSDAPVEAPATMPVSPSSAYDEATPPRSAAASGRRANRRCRGRGASATAIAA